MNTDTLNSLEEYGAKLKAAGFRVWITKSGSRAYMTYERNGFYGHLQESFSEGWAHDMPIVPSKEYGSSMFIGNPVEDVWSVEAAEQAASETNRNNVVGTQRNAGKRTWISPDSQEL